MGNNSTPTDTLFIGNLDQRVTTRIIYDLCIQASSLMCKMLIMGSSLALYHVIQAAMAEELHASLLQAGPVQRVNLPEAYTGVHKGYAFCHYETVVGHRPRGVIWSTHSVASHSIAHVSSQQHAGLGRSITPVALSFDHAGERKICPCTFQGPDLSLWEACVNSLLARRQDRQLKPSA